MKRLCRQCHAPATHVEIHQRPTAYIALDGTVTRGIENVYVYWCAKHTGMR